MLRKYFFQKKNASDDESDASENDVNENVAGDENERFGRGRDARYNRRCYYGYQVLYQHPC